MAYSRYAIYFTPEEDTALAAFGARWLGWDVAQGREADHYPISGLSETTATPRKYGFHATLKPPFQLADGRSVDDLALSVRTLAKDLKRANAGGLELNVLGRFLALTLRGDATQVNEIAARCVSDLDDFRAPPSEAELAKRRGAGLSPQQEALLQRWGYPHVMETFRFHMTLTQRMPRDEIEHWRAIAKDTLPPLEHPFELTNLCLLGERPDRRFELIQRYPLGQ